MNQIAGGWGDKRGVLSMAAPNTFSFAINTG